MDPKFYVTIENAAGVAYGKGDLVAVTRWNQTARLDNAGEFSFEVHSSDPMCAQLEEKRYARCWYIENSVLKNTRGIIDKIETDVDSGMITVSGGDMLRELANTTVGTLYIHTDTNYMPTYVGYTHYDTAPPYETDLTNAYDGALPGTLGTYETFHIHTGDPGNWLDWIYVDYSKAFSGVTFTMNGTKNDTASVLSAQYYTSNDGWVDFEGLSDGTSTGGKCFAQSGEVAWTMPTGWEVYNTGHGNLYRARFRVSVTTSDFDLHSCYIRVEEKSASALSTIVALASGWSVDDTAGDPPYAETSATVLGTFENDSVLAALVWLSEQTGEHFRYSADRKIYWLRTDTPSSGIRAERGGPNNDDLDTNTSVCIIKDLKRTRDSYDLVTRIYPYGSGLGAAKLNLASTTQSAPAGYTLSLAGDNSYISRDSAEATYGVIGRRKVYKEVTAKDTQPDSVAQAADDLFKRALTDLQRTSAPIQEYTMSVVGLKTTLYPGQTIHVEYHEWIGSYHSINIDTDLIILETRNEMDSDGSLRTVGLTVSTIAAWTMSQEDLLVRTIQQSAALGLKSQPIPVESIRADNVPAGKVLMTTPNAGLAFVDLGSTSFTVFLDYVPLLGGTMTGTLNLPNSQAQGNALITPINSANSTINWARVSKSGSNLTDLATRAHSGLTGIGANDHHNQAHVITGADHTVTGAALDIVGLSTTNTLGILTPSADVSAGASAILKSASGALTLATLTTNTLNIGADVQLTRSAANVLALAAGDSFQHADYAMDSDGARITDTGHGYFRYLYATEFHAKSFIADLEVALAGGQLICKSVAPLAADFTAPAAGASTGLVVQDFQGFSTFHVFVDGDFVNIRSFSRPSNEEKVSNGGFETLGGGGADVFGSWTETAGDGAIAAEATIKNSGSYSAKLTCGASNNTSMHQDIAVSAGQARTLRFYARGDGTHAGYYQVWDATNSANIVATTTTGVTGTTWTLVTVPYTVPAGCATVGLWFTPGATNGYVAYFDDVTDKGNSELMIGDCWGTVEYASRDDAAKVQTYVFTRRSGTIGAGNAPGSIAATTVIAKGTLALDYGTSGNGYIESVAQSGAMASGVPYQQIVTWATEPGVTANKTVRTRIGNLNGTYGIAADYFGVGLGDYAGGNYLRYETSGGLVIQSTSGNVTMDGYGLWMDSAPAWTSSYLGLGGSAAAPTSQLMQTSSYQMQRTGIASPPSGFRKLIQADMTDVNSNWIADETLVYGSTGGGYSQWAMDFWDGSASTNVLTIRGVNGGAWDPALIYTAELRRGKNSTTYQGYIFVPLTTPLTSTSWDGDAYSDVAATTLDLSAVFSAPAGIKAVAVKLAARDSGSAGTRTYVGVGPASGQYAVECEVTGLANDTIRSFSGVVPCDANGDIVYIIEASGASTMDIWMTIWGYWI